MLLVTKIPCLILLLAVVLTGCAASQSGSVYSRDQARQVQNVRLGVVESVRPVMIEGTRSNIGTGAGAALGGVAGSEIGKGKGAVAGAIGGAVLGGVAGAAVEEGFTARRGLEIVVRLNSGQLLAVVQEADQPFYRGQPVKVLTGYDGTARVVH
ncbi:MAG: glycine zipper 2TM domain-containing protein [Candidatus Competibacteraceae bacterium]|nr:glycine zipper 2TM domain-containing protein [Candidatus Competibacteraceae bacterium]